MKIIEDPAGGAEVIVNTAGAVIPQHAEVALLAYTDGAGTGMVVGLELEGPRTDDDLESRSDELYLLDTAMTARLVALLMGIVAQESGEETRAAFFDGLQQRIDRLRAVADGAAE